jgi:hypothetical protein
VLGAGWVFFLNLLLLLLLPFRNGFFDAPRMV